MEESTVCIVIKHSSTHEKVLERSNKITCMQVFCNQNSKNFETTVKLLCKVFSYNFVSSYFFKTINLTIFSLQILPIIFKIRLKASAYLVLSSTLARTCLHAEILAVPWTCYLPTSPYLWLHYVLGLKCLSTPFCPQNPFYFKIQLKHPFKITHQLKLFLIKILSHLNYWLSFPISVLTFVISLVHQH